jgi:hypothetical protein
VPIILHPEGDVNLFEEPEPQRCSVLASPDLGALLGTGIAAKRGADRKTGKV